MGLAERRASAQYQQNVFPVWQKKFNDLLGYPLEIEVDWPTMGEDGLAHLFEWGMNVIYFEPLMLALQAIAVDDFSKQALRDGFKKYYVSGVEPENRVFFSFSDKTLFYQLKFGGNENDLPDRRDRLVQLLEKNL
ncbi:hypothetical protein OV207_34065 [Corallococcus sp. BB11-1]|uniref:hypothetical protein n=1 Tax=Corallococcus sp. BB11-1 TaxID=2996783 RepID=UPI0010EE1E4D|nr:hypothetical protein [Corallococcus sp. BB11-1]MCY1036512.1 hypothetical protein [Corallococcus sp. BB11-1]RYZ16752.1 MAG: hypothetical protein EOO70_03720 [Myxococcaceae bacterium]